MSDKYTMLDVEGTFACIVNAPVYGWFDETSKGSRYVKIPCEVNEPGTPHHGKKIAYIGYLTSRAIDNTEKILCEVFGTDWTWTNPPFAGKNVVIVAEAEEYNGKTKIKAKYINAPGSIPTTKRSPEEAQNLSQSIADSLPPRLLSNAAQPALTKQPYKSTDLDGDDIPF